MTRHAGFTYHTYKIARLLALAKVSLEMDVIMLLCKYLDIYKNDNLCQ